MTDYKLVPVKRCAACGNEKPVSEMETCMHNQMHRYVCDSKCMNDFYNPPNNPRPDAVAPAVQGEPMAITDADILAIAGRVESCPVSPWWLKDYVAIGDVRAAVLRFARALLVAAPQPAEQQPVYQRCEYCDGAGDVHSIDGEWRGACDCQQPAPDVDMLAVGVIEVSRR